MCSDLASPWCGVHPWLPWILAVWIDSVFPPERSVLAAGGRVTAGGDRLDHMFEDWPVMFDPPPYRTVSPAVPVIVHVGSALGGAAAGQRADTLPLRVRAECLAVDVQVSGRLSAWARTSAGSWICRVAFSIPTGNGMGYLDVDQWCPAAAVRPVA